MTLTIYDNTQVSIRQFEEGTTDAFRRLRSSLPDMQVQVQQNSASHNLYVTRGTLSGDATATWSQNRSSTLLSVTGNLGKSMVRSRYAGLYRAGESLLVLFSGVMGSPAPGVTTDFFYAGGGDGIILRQSGSQISWNIQSGVSGIPTIAETANQNEWQDLGFEIDFARRNLAFVNLQWLGVGAVVCGFVDPAGIPRIAHIFRHINNGESVYMRRASLFVGASIERSVAGGNSKQSEFICGSVIHEGAIDRRHYFLLTCHPIGNPAHYS